MRIFAGIVALFWLIVPLSLPACAAPKFPALTGRVVDDAHVLSEATKADLNTKLAALEEKTSRQLIVVTIPSLQGYEISDYGYQLGRAWGIGQKTLNNGALFIIAPTEHKTRVEVGYGLEPILTDALSSLIIQKAVLPNFRKGDFNAGAEAGSDALIAQLSLETSAAEAKAAAAEQAAQNRGQGGGSPFSALLILLFIGFAIFRVFGGWGLLPLLFMGGGGGGRGGWGDGGGGFGGGGGGSFGGGGASGSW